MNIDRRQRKPSKSLPSKTRFVGPRTVFRNPYKITPIGKGWFAVTNKYTEFDSRSYTKAEARGCAAAMYEAHYVTHPALRLAIDKLREEVRAGRIKHLACYCSVDEPCHADFIIRKIKEQL